MKNRLDYLANEESRMLKKIDRMNSLIQKREKVLMKKWEDQIHYNQEKTALVTEIDQKRKSVQFDYLHRQDEKIKKGFENYMIQKQAVEEL